jgi:hypothetical protein
MPETRKPGELAQFASDLQLMKHRAINLRLYANGQWLDSAIRTLAIEIAGHTEDSSKYEAAPAASKRHTAVAVTGREFHFREATPCPRCGSTESEMRTYGGSWDDADTHCAQCGKLIHRAWFPMRGY